MPSNPYTSQTIAGFNASPPPDDGTRSAANQLEWQKHLDKIGLPLRTFIEAVNSQVLAAFGALVMTDDPAQETALIAFEDLIQQVPMLAQHARRADTAAKADDLRRPAENTVVMMQEFV